MENSNGQDKKPGLSWSTPSQPVSNTPNTMQKVVPPVSMQKSLPVGETMSQTGSHTGTYVGFLAGGIVVGVLLAWGYSAVTNHSSDSTVSDAAVATQTSGSTSTTGALTGSTNSAVAAGVTMTTSAALDIPSPQKAGKSVTITKVTVTKPTWVVVYDNVGGKPGNALGAHLFFATGSGTVTLLRSTVAGKTYFVGLSIDNGNRTYAKATDKALLNSDGTMELTTFVAQ